MNYKKDIEKMLFHLKEINIERERIENDLNYSINYIDQVLSKGGNKRFYLALKKYSDRMLQKETLKSENAIVRDHDSEDLKWQLNEDEPLYELKKQATDIEKEFLKKRVEDLEKIVALQDDLLRSKKNIVNPEEKKRAG